ncbi:MAG: c-type cytochrome [Anaerolineae bacterium]
MNTSRLSRSGSLFWAVLLPIILLLFLAGFAAAQEPLQPDTKPDGISGLELYQSRCANCHGPSGAGDGEMAANLPTPPKAINDPEYRKTADPAAIFTLIDQGNLDIGMPPFGAANTQNPLNAASIWNLVGAVYSISTPPEALAQGQVVYEDNCLACHGESGQGDGPDAGDTSADLLDLTGLDYWFSRTNEMVFTDIASGGIPEHAYDLTEAEQWAVVDYARAFSYLYHDPQEPIPPIATAVITGTVNNGATGELMPGLTAQLRAFTTSFEQTLDMTTTISADGVYQFDLENVDANWVYLTSVRYNGLSFSSDARQLTRVNPEMALPVTVYEQTDDPSAITIEQMHLVFGFFDGTLEVTELYVFSNAGTAVFIGDTGLPEEGTIKISLPENAQNVSFERTMGSTQNTIPADEVIQTASGYADTIPVRPGAGVLNLIVRYTLPYKNSAEFSHKMMYDTPSVTAIVPDAGVSLKGDNWQANSPQQMPGGGTFTSFQHQFIAAGGEVVVTMDGRPQTITDTAGNVVPVRNNTTEILIGAGIFLVVIGAVFLVLRNWRSASVDGEYDDDEFFTEEDLIQEIAGLDEAFENGEMDEKAYRAERAALKAELKALWEEG